ncbi:MAG: hypothetical protein NC826_04445 [Candidatus Omnitrophica bacterium]|nr:hypothetical protein [Candidatus Omnitrophota bacterium]
MAVAKIQKISILGLQDTKDRVLDYLQECGVVELLSNHIRERTFTVDTTSLEKDIEILSSTLKFLYSLSPKKISFFKEKNKLNLEDWRKIIREYDYIKIVREVDSLREELKEKSQKKIKLKEEQALIYNYKNLDITLKELSSLKNISFYIGKIKKKNILAFSKKIERIKTNFIQRLSEDKNFVFLIIFFFIRDSLKLEKILEEFGFEKITLPFSNFTVSQRFCIIEEEINLIERDLYLINKKLRNYLKEIPNLETVFDHLYYLFKKIIANNNLGSTQNTFILEGWVRQSDSLRLKQRLEEKFLVAVYLSDPHREEDVPTVLQNKPILNSFEPIVQLYGLPKYESIDPTESLALFFIISFALCLSDAGYGLILSLVSFYILKRFTLSITVRKFFQLFLLGGVFTVIVGALTGGWFGNFLDKLPPYFINFVKIKNVLIQFDPLKEPLKFLVLILFLGYIQTTFGIFLKLIQQLKEKDYFGLVFSQLPTFLVQILLFLLVLNFAKMIPDKVRGLIISILGVLFVLIIFYHFRAQRSLALKMFWSIYGIYSIIIGNFLSDILSFSRLFALGLTTGLLATAINEIVFIFKDTLISLKLNFLIVGLLTSSLFIIGHILNIAINLLGAYVHTSRLQYLEYFSKFFEIGGRPFRPFRKEYFYTELIRQKEGDLWKD